MRSEAELARLKRIEELMILDPALDTPEGQELDKLVEEQVAAERHLMIIDDPHWKPDPNWNPDE